MRAEGKKDEADEAANEAAMQVGARLVFSTRLRQYAKLKSFDAINEDEDDIQPTDKPAS